MSGSRGLMILDFVSHCQPAPPYRYAPVPLRKAAYY